MELEESTGLPSEWIRPDRIPHLTEAGLQLWRYEIDARAGAQTLVAAERILDAAERTRAEHLRLASARNEFVAARVLLRVLLASTTGVDVQRIAFADGPNGKPHLVGVTDLDFNVSHSGGLILIALSTVGTVGVDVEFRNPARGWTDLLPIARETVTLQEVDRIEQADSPATSQYEFYRAWTRKEAVAKADGRGIAMPLSYTLFGDNKQGECRVSVGGADGGRAVDYFVQTPDVGARHLAAIATLRERQPITLLDADGLLIR